MSDMTNILVKDDAATPVEFTLNPISAVPNPMYRASVAGTPVEGQIRLSLEVEQLKSKSYKATAKVEVPVMETLGASGTAAGYVAPPKVAYVNTVIITMFADRRSTIQDRANALKLALGVAQGASATTATGVLNQASAGSAFANSVLPVTQMFTSLIKPS